MLNTKFSKIRHFFHIVDPSPWPFIVSLLVSVSAFSLIISFHYNIEWDFVYVQLIFLMTSVYSWFRDVLRESVYEGQHTRFVQTNIRFGMALFIISEIMFFFSFFWAFFHFALSPSIELGCVWPPLALQVFNPFSIPLLNTQILLLSGATLTWVHYSILNKYSFIRFMDFKIVAQGFILTLFLSFIFTSLQVLEYYQAPFSISDSVYGSSFFLMTGFHGFHVIIGTIFILVCFLQFLNVHFTHMHHVGFECAAWYWHFVDVVWLFLYVSIYWWGSWI